MIIGKLTYAGSVRIEDEELIGLFVECEETTLRDAPVMPLYQQVSVSLAAELEEPNPPAVAQERPTPIMDAFLKSDEFVCSASSRQATMLVLKGRQLERELAEAKGIIAETLKALPVGYIPNHTPKNLPQIAGGWAKEAAEECSRADALERELAEANEKLAEAWKLVNAMAGQEPWERAEQWLEDNRRFAPEGAQRV